MKKDWKYKTLGDIGKVSMCKRVLKKQTTENGDIPFYKIGTFGKVANAFISKKLYEELSTKYSYPKKGDILISASGTIGRRVVFDGEPSFFQDSNIVWIANDEVNVLNKYLYAFYGYCNWNPSKGATISRLYNSDLKRIPIPIPPLQEQKQIVTILDQAFTAIDQAKANIEKNIENAKELFQSKLNDIFSQKGDGWEEKTFEELSSKIGDGLHGTPKYDEDGEYYFINGNNLNDGTIKIKGNTKRVNKEEFEKYKKDLTLNTVLISINGTLGKVAFYNGEPVVLGKSACYINFNKEVNKHYIKYLVKCSLFFDNMASQSTGATIKNFSLKSMRNYKLHLPSIDEQIIIIENLQVFEKKIFQLDSNLNQKLADLVELKKSILQKAFAGELT